MRPVAVVPELCEAFILPLARALTFHRTPASDRSFILSSWAYSLQYVECLHNEHRRHCECWLFAVRVKK